MKEKVFKVLNKIYAILILVAFFAGLLPLIPFIIAIAIGGSSAEKICLFLYNEYYPWIIAIAAISVIVGLVAMYIEKIDGKCKKKQTANVAEQETVVNENVISHDNGDKEPLLIENEEKV